MIATDMLTAEATRMDTPVFVKTVLPAMEKLVARVQKTSLSNCETFLRDD